MHFVKSFIFFLAISTGYFFALKLGFLFQIPGQSVSPLWPATGFAIWAAVQFRFRAVLPILLVSLAVNFTRGMPWEGATSVAMGRLVEAFFGASVFLAFKLLTSKHGAGIFPFKIIFSSFSAAIAGAAFGVLGVYFSDTQLAESYTQHWVTWWSGNTLGSLLFLPLLYLTYNLASQQRTFDVPQAIKSILWNGCLLSLFIAAVYGLLRFENGIFYLTATVPLLLVFSAMGHKTLPYILAICAAALGFFALTDGIGPFYTGTMQANLLHLQIFFGTVAVAALFFHTIREIGSTRLPNLVMLCGCLLGAFITYRSALSQQKEDYTRFKDITEKNRALIETRLRWYENVMASSAAHVEAMYDYSPIKDFVILTDEEWREYVEDVGLLNRFPGLIGISIVNRVVDKDIPKLIQVMRRQKPDFTIKRLGSRVPSEGYYVTQVEPGGPNIAAHGIDLASHSTRHESTLLAAKTGAVVASGKIDLIRASDATEGLILQYPIFKLDEKNKPTALITGPILFEPLFRSIEYFGSDEVALKIAYADEPEDIIFQNGETYTGDIPLDVTEFEWARKKFRLYWYRLPTFRSSYDQTVAWIASLIIVAGLALATVIASVQAVRNRAEEIAKDIAADLERHRAATYHASKMSLLGEMAGGIAHEVNNPLAIIKGNTDILLKSVQAGNLDKAAVLERLLKVQKTVKRISDIVIGLRYFSRSGENLVKVPTSFKEIVNGVMELSGERIQKEGIELRLSSVPDVEVMAVGVQVQQVLMNLISNSIDAISDLDEKWIEIRFQIQVNQILTSVSDSGSGIPAEVAEKMLEPFYTTKEAGKGTGLGLSISKAIIEEHSGDFAYDKESPNTRFWFTLPLA